MNIQEYPTKFLHFSANRNVCFYMERSRLKYLNTEKSPCLNTSKTDLEAPIQKVNRVSVRFHFRPKNLFDNRILYLNLNEL